MTVTHDEYWHLPVGHLNLTTGRFDYDNLNPPLLRMWAAVPLVFSGTSPVDIDSETDPVGHGDAFLKANLASYHSLFLRGRIMIALLSVSTGVLMIWWSSTWFGNKAALLAGALWSFSPNVIAHGSLVTTDLGAAFFFAATLFTVVFYARNRTWKFAILAGLLLGLSQLAKYTCLILYPLALILFLILGLNQREELKKQWKKIVLQLATAGLISVLTINLGYLFEGSFQSFEDYSFQSQSMKNFSERFAFLPFVPFPADYIEGIDHQRSVMESQHPVYLNGEWSLEAFPQYYLMTLIYKVPHSVQVMFLVGLFLFFKEVREPGQLTRTFALLIPFLFLFLIASRSGMQLGLRYLLPVYPFLLIWISQVVEKIDFNKSRLIRICFLLIFLGIPLSLRSHPYHLSYFNEWAGGAEGGRFHLLDSNLDWGQDLRELKEYLDKNSVEDLKLAYFGMLLPAELGIDYSEPSRRVPQPGWYAISVNYVMGRPHHIRDMEGKSHPLGLDELGYFRFFEPEKIIGTSIYVYYLTSSDVSEWYSAVRQFQ